MYEEGFHRVWQEFMANCTVPVYDPLRTGFSRGRKSDLALAIRISPEQIPKGVLQIVDQLRFLKSILLFPSDYYHISVKLLGFLVEVPTQSDDIGMDELQAIRSQTAPILARATPFAIHLGSVNVLGSYVVLEADDGNYIPSLQAALHEEAPEIPAYGLEGTKWLPHLSLGAFQIPNPSEREKAQLANLRDLRGGILQVDQIQLVRAELQKPFPTFHVLETFTLSHLPKQPQ